VKSISDNIIHISTAGLLVTTSSSLPFVYCLTTTMVLAFYSNSSD